MQHDRLQQEVSPRLSSDFSFVEIQYLLYKVYKSKLNFRTERFNFHRAIQHPGQTISDYISFLQFWRLPIRSHDRPKHLE